MNSNFCIFRNYYGLTMNITCEKLSRMSYNILSIEYLLKSVNVSYRIAIMLYNRQYRDFDMDEPLLYVKQLIVFAHPILFLHRNALKVLSSLSSLLGM